DLPQVHVNDKVEHFLAYALLSAGAVQLFARRLSWGFVCVLLVLMGIGIEYMQAQMGLGRMLDRNDALANTVGVLLGLATAFTPLRDALLRLDRRLGMPRRGGKTMQQARMDARPRRHASVDVLRGWAVAAMLLVNYPGDWGHVYAPLEHSE